MLRAIKCEQRTGSRWAWKWTSNRLEMKLSFGLSEARHHRKPCQVEEPLSRACEKPAGGLYWDACEAIHPGPAISFSNPNPIPVSNLQLPTPTMRQTKSIFNIRNNFSISGHQKNEKENPKKLKQQSSIA